MSELHQIILTSSFTILGGIIIFITGQVVVRFLIEPIQEQYKVIGRIASSLLFYANVYANPGFVAKEFSDETTESLRRHASDLISSTRMIPLYRLWEVLGVSPKSEEIKQAFKDLIFLANSTHTGSTEWNIGARRRIEKSLHIEMVP